MCGSDRRLQDVAVTTRAEKNDKKLQKAGVLYQSWGSQRPSSFPENSVLLFLLAWHILPNPACYGRDRPCSFRSVSEAVKSTM